MWIIDLKDLSQAAGVPLSRMSYGVPTLSFDRDLNTSFVKLAPTPDFKQRRTSSRTISAKGQKRKFSRLALDVCS